MIKNLPNQSPDRGPNEFARLASLVNMHIVRFMTSM